MKGEKMTDYAARREMVIRSVDAEAFLAFNLEGSDPASIRYLTGFTGEGALILTDRQGVLLTDSRYTEQARRETAGFPIEESRTWTGDGLIEAFAGMGISRVSVASRRISHHFFEALGRSGKVTPVAIADPVAELRKIKSPEELASLTKAARIAEDALIRLLDEIKIGMDEAEIALRLEWMIREGEAEGVAFPFNVSAGENTALNHYNPFIGRRPIKRGDFLLFDFGACVDGYRSDITRTFSVGRPTGEAKEIYDTVLRANLAAIAAVRSGMTGVEADAVARDSIAAAGHAEHFGHGLGHGIGLEVHEAPFLSPRSKDTLGAGMTVTIEPGIYITGFGGVRIEDDIVITDEGCEVITSFPKDRLIEVG